MLSHYPTISHERWMSEDVPYLANACILGYYASSVFFPTETNCVTKEILPLNLLLLLDNSNWTKQHKEDASANL